MTGKYQKLREALEAGPTAGPWRTGQFMPAETIMRHQVVAPDVDGIPYVILEGNQNFPRDAERNAAYAAAAHPAVITDLLAERDALHEALQALYDAQNGPPLERYREEWEAAMAKSAEALK